MGSAFSEHFVDKHMKQAKEALEKRDVMRAKREFDEALHWRPAETVDVGTALGLPPSSSGGAGCGPSSSRAVLCRSGRDTPPVGANPLVPAAAPPHTAPVSAGDNTEPHRSPKALSRTASQLQDLLRMEGTRSHHDGGGRDDELESVELPSPPLLPLRPPTLPANCAWGGGGGGGSDEPTRSQGRTHRRRLSGLSGGEPAGPIVPPVRQQDGRKPEGGRAGSLGGVGPLGNGLSSSSFPLPTRAHFDAVYKTLQLRMAMAAAFASHKVWVAAEDEYLVVQQAAAVMLRPLGCSGVQLALLRQLWCSCCVGIGTVALEQAVAVTNGVQPTHGDLCRLALCQCAYAKGVIAENDGVTSAEMVPVLKLEGRALAEKGDGSKAVSTLQRCSGIAARRFGITSTERLEALELLRSVREQNAAGHCKERNSKMFQ